MDGVLIEVLAVVAGLALVLTTAADAVSTLVTTRRRRGRFWPTPVYYRWSWRAWRAVGRRARPELREGFLGSYGPLSLLGLLVLWVLLLVAGWGAVWWGLRTRATGIDGYLDAVYVAGVGFFTVGFGDILPVGDLARLLLIGEAFMGLVTMALVIGYLPTLYGAYSRREVQLLALDDLSDEPTTPIGFLEAGHAGGGSTGIAAAFADWERWCDEVYDSHTTYPMLAPFRSRQPGQRSTAPRPGRRPDCGGGPRGCSRPSRGCPRSGSGRPSWPARSATRAGSVPPTSAWASSGCRCTPTSRHGTTCAGGGPATIPSWSRPPSCCWCRSSSGTRRPGSTSPAQADRSGAGRSAAAPARPCQAARALRYSALASAGSRLR